MAMQGFCVRVLIIGALIFSSHSVGAEDNYVISTAHAGGVGGSLWQTAIEIENISGSSADVVVDLLPFNTDNTVPASVTVTVAAGSTTRIDDVLDTSFSFTGVAGLRLNGGSSSIRVTSRTFNDTNTSTSGSFLDGLPLSRHAAFGGSVNLLYLASTTDIRTNLTLFNSSDSAAALTAEIFDAAGSSLGTISRVINPFSGTQINSIFSILGASTIADATAVVTSSTPGSTFMAGAAVIDNTSADSLYVAGLTGDPLAEPHFVTTAYGFQTIGPKIWATDLSIRAGPAGAEVDISFLANDEANLSPLTVSHTLAANSSLRLVDIVSTSFAQVGFGALRITPTSGTIWAAAAHRISDSSGTFLSFQPAVPLAQSMGSGDVASMIQLTQTTNFASDLHLVNTGPDTISVTVDRRETDGFPIASESHELLGLEHLIISSVLPPDTADAFVLVSLASGSGRFIAATEVFDIRNLDIMHVPAAPRTWATLFFDGFELGTTEAWTSTVP